MNIPEFNVAIEGLFHYYGKPLNRQQINNWYTEFCNVYDSDLLKAIDAVKHNTNNNNFPSPNQIWKAIHEIRAESWNKKKMEEHKQAHEFFREDNKSGSALASITLVNAVLQDKLTAQELVEQMMLEESTYPDIGWEDEARLLQQDIDRRKAIPEFISF